MTINTVNPLPSAGQLSALPRWVAVALAARTARRVLPLYEGTIDGEQRDDVFAAVHHAERASDDVVIDWRHLAANAGGAFTLTSGAYAATEAAAEAARAAGAASALGKRPSNAGLKSELDRHVAKTLDIVISASEKSPAVTERIGADYRKLLDAERRASWSGCPWHDGTSFPAEEFGPLWPEGEPSWYLRWLSRGDLDVFPRNAIVAFAARCARNVACLFQVSSARLHRVLEESLAVAEGVACGKNHADEARAALRRMREVSDTSMSVVEAGRIAEAAWAATTAALEAAAELDHPEPAAFEAAQQVAVVASHRPVDAASLQRVLRSDFNVLACESEEVPWFDDSPVSPHVFGPAWKAGAYA